MKNGFNKFARLPAPEAAGNGGQATSGFTIIEIIVAISILSIIAVIFVSTFSRFNKAVTLSRDAEQIVSILNQARTNTIASKAGIQYGVHFETTKVVAFAGAVYIADASTNDTFYLKTFESLSNISFGGGGSNVVFSRVTGVTSNFGSITLSVLGAGAASKTISISANGLASLQ